MLHRTRPSPASAATELRPLSVCLSPLSPATLQQPVMAGRQGNQTWLRQQLQKALGWDDVEATEAVVAAVAAAVANSEDVEGLVEAYMGGNPKARQLVQQFCGMPPGVQARPRDATAPSTASGGGGGGGASSRPGSSGRSAPQAAEPAPQADQPKVGGGVETVAAAARGQR